MTNPNEMIKHHLTNIFNEAESAKIIAAVGDWPEICDDLVNASFSNNRGQALRTLAEIGVSV